MSKKEAGHLRHGLVMKPKKTVEQSLFLKVKMISSEPNHLGRT
ncbi:hypothetical protein [Endozoicomonas euniceicola]|uniref:Uncharacterized protein n=1 Tax=Endozoicomonas euniceicola TaxID=1234143 RepID=A0ABY6GQM6_9GAMM|nr:hypothetical protein [Endozoicomonas euniceicola]UYM14694.1 hypothetical protein NX720_17610 [Endozoicomonas euniceicola]